MAADNLQVIEECEWTHNTSVHSHGRQVGRMYLTTHGWYNGLAGEEIVASGFDRQSVMGGLLQHIRRMQHDS